MLNRFVTKDRNRPSVPEGERIYAIGDIHGRIDLLDALLARIDTDVAAPSLSPTDGRTVISRLVFLGDYVDRGPDSAGVVDRLVGLGQRDPAPVFIKGNHEAALLEFLHAPERHDAWLDWGGDETLRSYGIDPSAARPAADLARDLRAAMPAPHASFYRDLRASYELGDYFFVHAGVKPGVPLDAQDEKDLLWIRGEFHTTPASARPSKTIVHGHHPTRKPVDVGWRIGVDTGAVWTGVLTALVLQGTSRRFLSVDGPPSD